MPARRRRDTSTRTNNSRQAWATLGWAGAAWLASACGPARAIGGTPNSLAPRGPGAANIAELWWIMFGLGTLVFLVVMALFTYAIVARRSGATDWSVNRQAPEAHGWIWWGGIIVPAIILLVTFAFTLRTMRALASPPTEPAARIEVVGHQWWWEVHYEGEAFATANEIHIPVGQSVELHLTSADVIHSFWVPELHGKVDLNPGETNTLWLQADEAGIYRGMCAEFCGLQHAKMQLVVVAEAPEDYAAWVAAQREPAPEVGDSALREGQQVFLGSSCVYCHTVRGTPATGSVGPDLTHLASRLTLGAGIVRNNRGSLAGWIRDPQHLKPGNLMPPTALGAGELQALLDYLESLR